MEICTGREERNKESDKSSQKSVEELKAFFDIEKAYPEKQIRAIEVIRQKPVFCSQTLSEYMNVYYY